ncbi:MAG: DoxX family protein [Rhodospirillales bacterium]|nr:DoxX family protein [Rhodospirillales bacterium]MBO6785220.1 DoxX family protein [Rhodospirillales bacterium]
MSDQNINSQTAPYGALLLRVSLGVMFIAHGLILKYFTFTLGGTAQYFESIGYPGFLAYVVFAAETLGGIALILGFQTRLVAFALVPLLIGAMLEHTGNGWVFSAQGGGWEYPLFLIIASIVQGLLGGGAFALTKREFPLPLLPAGDDALASR